MDKDKELKCKMPACKTRLEGTQVFSNAEGTIRFNLCVNCRKTPFGSAMVPFAESDKAIKKSSDDKNANAKKRADDAASNQAQSLGMCQYPSCKEEDCKMWVTKAPHPLTKLHKGRYCERHRNILNSDNRVLPYRFGRVMEIVTTHVLTIKPLNVTKLAHAEGVEVRAVKLMFRAAVLASGNLSENVRSTKSTFKVGEDTFEEETLQLSTNVSSGIQDSTPAAVVPVAEAVAEDLRRGALIAEWEALRDQQLMTPADFNSRVEALTGGTR